VAIGEREELIVIEGGRVPSRGGMTSGAGGCREPGLCMRRVVGGVVVRDVAGSAIRRRPDVLVVDVALRARHVYVFADERIARGAVIEFGVEPSGCVVADLALLREAHLDVGRAVGGVEILGVASVATGRSALELASDVAGGAFKRGVRPGEREAGEFQMIEFGAEPGVGTVAGLAGGRKVEGFVIRLGRSLIIGRVARKTCSGESDELPHGLALVAIRTFQHCVSAKQRKPVVVLFQLLGSNVPTLHGVALFAISAKLAAMNIRVAVRAVAAHILEDQAGVALRAANLLVHPAQRVAGSIVVELRNASDGLPTRIGMAVFAGDADGPVGVPAVLFLGLRPREIRPDTDGNEQPEEQRE